MTIKAQEHSLQELMLIRIGRDDSRIRFGKADGFGLYQNEILTKSTKDLAQSY